MMQKFVLMRGGLKFLCSTNYNYNYNYNYKTPTLLLLAGASASNPFLFYTSKSQNHDHDNSSDIDDDATTQELKAKIDKFYKGDFDAIPDIFESILKRKLSGKHQDSDDELMNEFRKDQPDVNIDEDVDAGSSSDSD